MKKYLAMLVAAMLCAGCLGLAACGGSSGSASSSAASESASASAASGSASASAASGSASASAASESASASAASSAASASAASASASAASSAASAASASASAATSSEVTPEFKKFVDDYVVVCDELNAVVDKAKEAGSYEAVEDEWTAVSNKLSEYTTEAQKYAQMYANGELSKADMDYYDDVLLPAALDSANASLEMLDLIK